MDEKQIRQIAGKQKMPAGTIEKDYVLAIILSKIGKTDFAKEFAFKGGTAIKKAYFSEARFSEDLDFTCNTIQAPERLKEFLEEELSNAKIGCIQFNKTTKTSQKKDSVKLKLAYFGIAGHPQSVNFDLSLREKIILPAEEKEITNSYDQPKTKINTMNLTEIMAEKMRALTTRSLPRDLYDVWFLSKNNVKIDYKIVEQKLAYYNKKLEIQKIGEIINKIEKTWKRDLERLIRPVPAYSRVAAETAKILKNNNFKQ